MGYWRRPRRRKGTSWKPWRFKLV
ncbi:unnamed protein product [Callosobruchus maculatus]|uniref:Uncharacterized protein n=1 Tax=Callosobruchus maculatus TaxID=64391 RepID=A0A653C5V3_CALMS|nr:unnamed protein product [Callosobruchus maculatus]